MEPRLALVRLAAVVGMAVANPLTRDTNSKDCDDCWKRKLSEGLWAGGRFFVGDWLEVRSPSRQPPPGAAPSDLALALEDFANSLTLTTRLLPPWGVAAAGERDEDDDTRNSKAVQGKGKKSKKSSSWASAVMSGGTMFTVALAALSALAGKALMASMLALVLSVLAAIRAGPGGFDERHPSYEIVTRPVVTQHTKHTSEIQYQPPPPYARPTAYQSE